VVAARSLWTNENHLTPSRTPFRTVFHFVPDALPLPAPGEGAAAGNADFRGQVSF